MPIKYSDSPSTISYEYLDHIPNKKVFKGKINLAALSLYGFYRNSVYDSYKEKADLAADIKTRKKEFIEKDNSRSNDDLYKDSNPVPMLRDVAIAPPSEEQPNFSITPGELLNLLTADCTRYPGISHWD